MRNMLPLQAGTAQYWWYHRKYRPEHSPDTLIFRRLVLHMPMSTGRSNGSTTATAPTSDYRETLPIASFDYEHSALWRTSLHSLR